MKMLRQLLEEEESKGTPHIKTEAYSREEKPRMSMLKDLVEVHVDDLHNKVRI